MQTIKPGSVGVMLDDPRNPPRMFELTDEPHRMGIASFAPLDDPLARVAHRLSEFWPLIDSMP
jgi:hypothetical protein